MAQLQQALRQDLDPNSQRWSLFAKSSHQLISTKSIIKVCYHESRTNSRMTAFQGVLLAIRRGPGNPTFVVRSIIDGIQVEQCFSVFSPLIKKIELVSPYPGKTGKKFFDLRANREHFERLINLKSKAK